MDPETLKEVGPTVIVILCCGGLTAGLFGIAGLLKSLPKPHGKIEKPWSAITVGDAWGLNKIGSKRFKVDGDEKKISGPKFK